MYNVNVYVQSVVQTVIFLNSLRKAWKMQNVVLDVVLRN